TMTSGAYRAPAEDDERPVGDRDEAPLVALVERLAANERDILGDLEALGAPEDLFVRGGGPEVVDAKVECCDGDGFGQPDKDRQTARRVEKRRDGPSVNHTGQRVAHELDVVGQRHGDSATRQ